MPISFIIKKFNFTLTNSPQNILKSLIENLIQLIHTQIYILIYGIWFIYSKQYIIVYLTDK